MGGRQTTHICNISMERSTTKNKTELCREKIATRLPKYCTHYFCLITLSPQTIESRAIAISAGLQSCFHYDAKERDTPPHPQQKSLKQNHLDLVLFRLAMPCNIVLHPIILDKYSLKARPREINKKVLCGVHDGVNYSCYTWSISGGSFLGLLRFIFRIPVAHYFFDLSWTIC